MTARHLADDPTAASYAAGTEARIVEFGRRWYPYGGGPAEDILVEFGWAPVRFFTELETVLTDRPPMGLPTDVRTSMLQICRNRRWIGE